jgi:hypothetical protein
VAAIVGDGVYDPRNERGSQRVELTGKRILDAHGSVGASASKGLRGLGFDEPEGYGFAQTGSREHAPN